MKATRYIIAILSILYVCVMAAQTGYAYYLEKFYLLNNPTQYVLVLLLGTALWTYPYPGKRRILVASALIAISVSTIIVGSLIDLNKRVKLAEKIQLEPALSLRFFDESTIPNEMRADLTKRIKEESISIDIVQTLFNYFTGYDTCACGKGRALTSESGKIIFSVKHGHELYINGFLCFKTSISPTEYFEHNNTQQVSADNGDSAPLL